MQQLGTDRVFVQEQYSDADKLRIRIETHEHYSRGDTERIVDDCVTALDLSSGLRVLDVGCGAGSWHPSMTAAGAIVVGVDLMAGMLREARAADSALVPRPALVQADAQALPFASASFDRVLCAGVLYHVPECTRALLEMRRVLRPGGRAVNSTNGAYAMRRIYELHADAARELGYEPLPITPGHFTMDTCLCRADGLPVQIVSCGGTGTYPISSRQPGVTEVQAGGGIFCDVYYHDAMRVDHEYALTILPRSPAARPRVELCATPARRP